MKHRKRTKKSFMQIIMTELKRFYRKTHVAITVLDREGNPIAHCGGGIDVCRYIHLKLNGACRGCDKAALIWLLNGHDRCEYLCHAGLSEAAVLVRSGDVVSKSPYNKTARRDEFHRAVRGKPLEVSHTTHNDTSRGSAHEYKSQRGSDLRISRVRPLRLYNVLQTAIRGYPWPFPQTRRKRRHRR